MNGDPPDDDLFAWEDPDPAPVTRGFGPRHRWHKADPPDAPDRAVALIGLVVIMLVLACLVGSVVGVVFLYQLVRRLWAV